MSRLYIVPGGRKGIGPAVVESIGGDEGEQQPGLVVGLEHGVHSCAEKVDQVEELGAQQQVKGDTQQQQREDGRPATAFLHPQEEAGQCQGNDDHPRQKFAQAAANGAQGVDESTFEGLTIILMHAHSTKGKTATARVKPRVPTFRPNILREEPS